MSGWWKGRYFQVAEPASIGRLVAQLAADLGIEHPMESARLFSAWEAIVGPEVGAKCRPTALKNGILKVRTASAAWASEFRYLAPEMIKRVNKELGADIVKEIKPWVDTRPGHTR